MVSVTTHLYRRGKTYYFLIKIPADIKSHFGDKNHIVKSLKTSVLSDAKNAVEPLRAKVKSSFILIRSGLLTEEQVIKLIYSIACRAKPQHKQPEKKLSNLISMYIDEKTPNLKKRTLRDYVTIFNKIVLIIGDKELNQYTRQDAIYLRSKLLSDGLRERSCNTYLVLLSSLLRWAVRLTLCNFNFAESLILGIPSRQDQERKRFNNDDLQTIFSTIPLKDGDEGNAWIPLIALFTGMRREEICQLTRSDIRQEEGVWVFDINAKWEKTTKTDAGIRLVPIHSKLLEMGFIEFCCNRAKGRNEGNLWGFVKWRESWGKTWGGWFNYWFAAYVQKEKGKCFHSFRHTFTDELKQTGERKELVSELIGHTVNDMTFGRYGKRYSVELLRAATEKLSYDIDLSRIENFIITCQIIGVTKS